MQLVQKYIYLIYDIFCTVILVSNEYLFLDLISYVYCFPLRKQLTMSNKHETPGVRTGNDISEMTPLALFSHRV